MYGLDFLFSSSTEIVIVTNQNDKLTEDGINFIRSIYNPNKIVILKSNDLNKDFVELLSFTEDMKIIENNTTFYVCRDYSCNQPVNTLDELEKLLLS